MPVKITSTVEHDQDEYVSVHKRHHIFLPFTMWGARHTTMNIVDVMCDMTKPERDLFQELVNNLNETTHTSTLLPLSTSQSRKRSATLKLLVDKNLIKKVGQRAWMFNPELLIPEKSVREIIVIQWSQI